MKKILNLNLLFPKKEYIKYMSQVLSTRVFDGNAVNKEGLYSEEIFGPIGSEIRMNKFGYIDLYKEIIHPMIYINLISLSSLYKKVAEGKAYVILKKGEYIEVSEEEGNTGFNYFLETYKDLKHVENESKERTDKIKLVKKYSDPTYDKLLVYPAGLRDFTVDRHGNVKEHEMVEYYTKVLSISNLVKEYKNLGSDVDDIFLKLQLAVNELYEYLFSMIDGKNKIIGKNFASRYVDYGTMNVFTSTPIVIGNLDDDIDITATQLGLYQYIKSIDPLAKYCLNRFIAERCFSLDSNKARLFTAKFKTEYVDIENKTKELWTTQRGMDTIFNMSNKDKFLNSTVAIEGHYPLVISEDKDSVTIYTDSANIPEGVEVRGITYGEVLFYMLIIDDDHVKYPGAFTRHPVAGPNSIFISKINLNTTVDSLSRIVNIVEDEVWSKKVVNTPVLGNYYMLGFTTSVGRLSGLSADFDGDKGITRVLFLEETIQELNNFMNTVPYYVNPDKSPTHDFQDNISEFTMLTLTK